MKLRDVVKDHEELYKKFILGNEMIKLTEISEVNQNLLFSVVAASNTWLSLGQYTHEQLKYKTNEVLHILKYISLWGITKFYVIKEKKKVNHFLKIPQSQKIYD